MSVCQWMIKILVILVVISAALLLFIAVVPDESVVDLNGVNFSAWLKSTPVALVMFYDPESFPCRRLMPMYEMLAASLEDAVLAKVDCTDDLKEDICNEYVDFGFPTFTVFKDGRPWQNANDTHSAVILEVWKTAIAEKDANFAAEFSSEYARPLRNAATHIFALMDEKQAKDSPVVDLTAVNFAAWMKVHPLVLVMFYDPWNTHCRRLLSYFHGIGGALKMFSPDAVPAMVDCTSNEMKAICAQYAVDGFPTFTVFRNGLPLPHDNDDSPNPKREILRNLFAQTGSVVANAEFAAPLRRAFLQLIELPFARKADEL